MIISSTLISIVGLVVLLLLLILLITSRYKVAGPNEAFIVTGASAAGRCAIRRPV